MTESRSKQARWISYINDRPSGSDTPIESIGATTANQFVTAESVRTHFFTPRMPNKAPEQSKLIRQYLKTILKRTELTNKRFESERIPYRFRIFVDKTDEVLLEISKIDSNGAQTRYSSRRVTDADFGLLMDDISTGIGLMIDSTPARPH